MAARRDRCSSLAFTTGYGVEIGLLIDIYRKVGTGAIAQVDLDSRQNRHRPSKRSARWREPSPEPSLRARECLGSKARGLSGPPCVP